MNLKHFEVSSKIISGLNLIINRQRSRRCETGQEMTSLYGKTLPRSNGQERVKKLKHTRLPENKHRL